MTLGMSTMVSEISQAQKDKYCTCPLIRITESSQVHMSQEAELPGAEGRIIQESSLTGYRVQFRVMKKVLEMDGGDVCAMQ